MRAASYLIGVVQRHDDARANPASSRSGLLSRTAMRLSLRAARPPALQIGWERRSHFWTLSAVDARAARVLRRLRDCCGAASQLPAQLGSRARQFPSALRALRRPYPIAGSASEIPGKSLGVVRLVQIVLLNLARSRKARRAIAAARILLEQEVVGVDGGLKIFRIEQPAHLLIQLGFGNQRRRRFFRLRRRSDRLCGRRRRFVCNRRASGLSQDSPSSIVRIFTARSNCSRASVFVGSVAEQREDTKTQRASPSDDEALRIERVNSAECIDAFHSFVKTTRPFASASRRTGGLGGLQSVGLRPESGPEVSVGYLLHVPLRFRGKPERRRSDPRRARPRCMPRATSSSRRCSDRAAISDTSSRPRRSGPGRKGCRRRSVAPSRESIASIPRLPFAKPPADSSPIRC